MDNLDRTTQKHIQVYFETGEEFVIEGMKDFNAFKVKGNQVVQDGVDKDGIKRYNHQLCIDGNKSSKAYMLLKDKNGLQYLMRHTLTYLEKENRYSSVCRCYDLMNESEIERLEIYCQRKGIESPRTEPIVINYKGKPVNEFGQLWLVMTHGTFTAHRARKLDVPSDLNMPFAGIDADAYLSFFSTFSHSYDRGLGKNTMARVEEITARLHEGVPSIKFVGEMTPLDFGQKFKRKEGDTHKVMYDEYGMLREDDCYCAIATVYQKLGFKVQTFSDLTSKKSHSSIGLKIRATLLSKELKPNEVLKTSTLPKHFANPIDYENYDEM